MTWWPSKNWGTIGAFLEQLFGGDTYDPMTQLPTPSTPPTPPIPPVDPLAPTLNLLTRFCLAIKSREGFFPPCPRYPQGTPSYRNNNPGNCRFSPIGYLPIYGPVKCSSAGFAIFKDYATGFLYLQNMVKEKIHMHPNETIQAFFNSYAPISDGNDPVSYCLEVCGKIGLKPTDVVSKIL